MSDRDELFRLFQGMHQGASGAEDLQRLQGLLRADLAARRLWYLSCDVEVGLAAAVSVGARRLRTSVRWIRHTAWGSAAAAILLAALWVGLPARDAAQPVFATLVAADGARWADPNTELMLRGCELPSGRMVLESGRVEFLFSGGARVAVEGPAAFEPSGSQQISLDRGKVLCQCLDERSRMTVITPLAAVVDLGTEFAVEADGGQATHVAVISGAVSIASQGSTRRVVKDEEAVIGVDHLVRVEARKPEDFAALMRLDPLPTVAVGDRAAQLIAPSFAGDFPGSWAFTSGHCARVEGRGIAGGAAVRIRALGNRYWPLISQRVAVVGAGGRLAIGSIAALNPADDPLNAAQHVIVKLICRDAKELELGQAECHFLRASQPRDRYVRGEVRLAVPPGTATIEFQALLNARGLATGSVYLDEPALCLAPEEPPRATGAP